MSRVSLNHSDMWNAVIGAVLEDSVDFGTGAMMVSRDGERVRTDPIPYEGMLEFEVVQVGA